MDNKEKIEIVDENNCIHQYDSQNMNPWDVEEKLTREKELDSKIDKILQRDKNKLDYFAKKERNRTLVGLVLLGISIAVLISGIFFGDITSSLWNKAIKICTGCVGIG